MFWSALYFFQFNSSITFLFVLISLKIFRIKMNTERSIHTKLINNDEECDGRRQILNLKYLVLLEIDA